MDRLALSKSHLWIWVFLLVFCLTASGWMRHLCGGFLSDVSSLLCCVLGRRLKGAAHSKNGEDEHLLTVWRPGEPEERAGNKEGILELGSARNHCKN